MRITLNASKSGKALWSFRLSPIGTILFLVAMYLFVLLMLPFKFVFWLFGFRGPIRIQWVDLPNGQREFRNWEVTTPSSKWFERD